MDDKAHELTASHCSSQTKETDPRPLPAPREYAVSSAVNFMKSPNTATVPKEDKEKFLMSKGLSKEEILAASMRAYDSATPKVPPASSSNDKPELSNQDSSSAQAYDAASPEAPPPFSYKDKPGQSRLNLGFLFVMLAGFTGILYGAQEVYKRFVAQRPSSGEKDKGKDENKSAEDCSENESAAALLQDIRGSMQTVEKKMDEQETRIISLTRRVDDLQIDSQGLTARELKEEFERVKGLMLASETFPKKAALPGWIMPKPKPGEPPVTTSPPDSSDENSDVSEDVSSKGGPFRKNETGMLPEEGRNGAMFEMPNGVQTDEYNFDSATVGKPGNTGLRVNKSLSPGQFDSSMNSVGTVINVENVKHPEIAVGILSNNSDATDIPGGSDRQTTKPKTLSESLRSQMEEIVITETRPGDTTVSVADLSVEEPGKKQTSKLHCDAGDSSNSTMKEMPEMVTDDDLLARGAQGFARGAFTDENSAKSDNPDPEKHESSSRK